MMNSKAGQIVWHDLFTSDRDRAMAFYGQVAKWRFQVERAMDFAWGGGEKDFVLAIGGQEAGAGFAETPAGLPSGWIPYVEVWDVDAAVARAQALAAEVVRPAFEVPGVGRNALIRDPLGALVGLSLSRHSFPVPHKQFGAEVYLSHADDFPKNFYEEMFEWAVFDTTASENRGIVVAGPSGDPVAFHYPKEWPAGTQATWLPSIRVTSLDEAQSVAEAKGARHSQDVNTDPNNGRGIIFRDPEGTFFALREE